MGTTRRKSGVLADEIEPYRQWLVGRGHTPETIRLMLRELSQLGLWLAAHDLPGSSIDTASVAAMFEQRRRQGHRAPGVRGARVVEQFLLDRGLLTVQSVDPSELDLLLTRFHGWLVDERNLTESTVLRYGNTARMWRG